MEQEEKLCDEVETERKFTYLGNRWRMSGCCDCLNKMWVG